MALFSRGPRQPKPQSKWVTRPDVESYLQRLGPQEREIIVTLQSLERMDGMPSDEEVMGVMTAFVSLPILDNPLPGVMVATRSRLFYWPGPENGPLFSSWPGGVVRVEGDDHVVHLGVVEPEKVLATEPFKLVLGEDHSGDILFEIGIDEEPRSRKLHQETVDRFLALPG